MRVVYKMSWENRAEDAHPPVVDGALVRARVDDLVTASNRPAPYRALEGAPQASSPGGRTWRKDLHILREANLLLSGLPHPNRRHGEATGVQLVPRLKPVEMHLTSDEHAALRWARRVTPIESPASPAPGTTTTVDALSAVMRMIEESEDGAVTVEQVAIATDSSRGEALKLLATLAGDGGANGGLPLDALYVDLDDDDAFAAAQARGEHVVRVEVTPQEEGRVGHSPSPAAGTGLALLGLFAYSEDETRDRLKLIRAALGSGHPELLLHTENLHAADRKLRAWLDRCATIREDVRTAS